jgi:tetratricopeptide (TPR) repeat protein
MSIEEARLLLLRSRIDGASSREQEQDTLLQELDYLPLAIMQAVSYMIKRRMTIPQYLELFRHSEASRLTLLEQKFVSLGRQATSFDSVATTWIVTFHQVRVENPSAAELLCMLSLLDREDISGGYSDPAAFNVAMGLLESYSFVSTNETGDNYSMHRLVQSASRAWLMDQEALFKQLSSRVVQAVSTQFPNCEFENWSTCARYLPHAESILSHRLESGTEVDRRARAKLLANVSWYVKCQGNYSLARQRAEESLEIYRVTGQSDCVEALQVKCKLASILVQQGHLEDAIKLYRKTLEEQENLLGVDHHDTSDTVDQLALALANTLPPENWKMAEVLANKALANRQLSLPDNHPKM